MDPLTMAMIGAGIGGLKHFMESGARDQRAADHARSRKVDRAIALYSPWNRLSLERAQRPQEESLVGNLIGGGLTGFGFGQQIGAADSAKKLNEAKLKYYHDLQKPPTLGV